MYTHDRIFPRSIIVFCSIWIFSYLFTLLHIAHQLFLTKQNVTKHDCINSILLPNSRLFSFLKKEENILLHNIASIHVYCGM